MSVRFDELHFNECSIFFNMRLARFHGCQNIPREEVSLGRRRGKPGHPTMQLLTNQKRSVIRIQNKDQLCCARGFSFFVVVLFHDECSFFFNMRVPLNEFFLSVPFLEPFAF